MFCCQRIGWVVFVLSLLLFGCSSLHVETSSSFDWSRVKRVSVLPPQTDSWNLLPAFHRELAAMRVDSSVDAEHADLLMQFSVQEGPDIDSQGNVHNRLNSLHLQFVDPSNEKIVAVTDYFYADTDIDPAKGVKAAFAGLQKRLAWLRTEPAPQTVTAESNSASKQVSLATEEEQKDVQTAEVQATVQSEPTTEASPVAEKPIRPTPQQTVTDNIAPQTESPWVPRLKSWGFEEWGEKSDVDDSY